MPLTCTAISWTMVNVAPSAEVRVCGSWDVSLARYLHREWNQRSPRLRKYHSVPVLRLVPSDRPLFFCENCCSANLYVPICLWCKWTSAAAVKNFEETTPRGRTMSAPRLRSAGLERTTKKSRRGGVVVLEKPEPRGSLDTDRSSEPPQTPRSQSRYDTSPAIAVADEDEWVKLSMDDVPLPTAFAQSPYDLYYWGRVRNRKQRPSAIDNNHDSITSLNRSTYTPWSDGGLGGESRSFFSDDESQWFYDSSGFRYGGTDGEGHVSQPAHNPIGTRKPVARSSSPPPSLNRRPLYHYIRNKTPTAQSTFDCGVVPEITPKQHIPPQQYANRLVQQPTAAFPPSVDELGFLTPALPIMSSSRKGFSLSGETEQKMDLERKVHDGRFVFHEGKPRKRDRIMRGLRRFKSFFNSQG